MFRMVLSQNMHLFSGRGSWWAAILIGTNLLFNVLANSNFKISAISPTLRDFLGWQVIGNLAGLATVTITIPREVFW